MAVKSKYVIALDQVQAKVFEYMKPLGFRKKGRTFNREAHEPGIFQIVQFQTGPYELAPEIPPFRLNFYGKFTINIGVLVKELYDFVEWHKPKSFYQEVDCQARSRLSHLLYGKDVWWDLTSDVDELSTTIVDGFRSVGFDYFALYDTRVKFRENYGRFGDAPPRAKLDVALMVLHHDRAEGERLFREYYERTDRSHPHFEYVKDLAARLHIE